MDEIIVRVLGDFADRFTGPLKFRLVLQPIVAIVLATIGGRRDAREGKPAYFWDLFHDPAHRVEMLEDGWKHIGKLFIVAMVLDLAYQWIATRIVWPGEAVAVAIFLSIVPYLFVRGLVTRLLRK